VSRCPAPSLVERATSPHVLSTAILAVPASLTAGMEGTDFEKEIRYPPSTFV